MPVLLFIVAQFELEWLAVARSSDDTKTEVEIFPEYT
jgi:hypothetical protein